MYLFFYVIMQDIRLIRQTVKKHFRNIRKQAICKEEDTRGSGRRRNTVGSHRYALRVYIIRYIYIHRPVVQRVCSTDVILYLHLYLDALIVLTMSSEQRMNEDVRDSTSGEEGPSRFMWNGREGWA